MLVTRTVPVVLGLSQVLCNQLNFEALCTLNGGLLQQVASLEAWSCLLSQQPESSNESLELVCIQLQAAAGQVSGGQNSHDFVDLSSCDLI